MTAKEGKTILLVESASSREQKFQEKLKTIGCDVITAATGDEAAPIVFADKSIGHIIMDIETATELFETNRRLANELSERKLAEEEHRLSEARFRALFENSPNGIIISDPESLIIVDCNANAAIMNGYEREELIGRSLNTLHTDEVAAGVVDAVAQNKHLDTLHEGVVTAEGIHRRKDGSLFPIETSYSLITLGGKQLVMGIDRDISERKHAEDALHESEEIFNCFMDHSPIYVFFKDEKIRSLRLSRNYEQMLGRPISELLGKTMDDLFPSDLAKRMIADDQKILTGDKEVVVEEELNGRFYTTTKFPIHIKGRPPYLAGFTIDITERKLAEDAMRTTKILLEQTFEQSPIPMVLVSMPDAVIRIANPACIEFLGMQNEPSPVNIPLMELKPSWEDYDMDGKPGTTTELPLPRSLRGLRTNAEERTIVRNDGTVRNALVYGCPIFDAEGTVVAGYCIMLDISEKQKMMESLQRTQKLESLGILAGGIAHDFNNLLAGIFGYLDMAKESAARNKTEQVPKYIDKALGVFDRAKGLTQQLLTFSKGGVPVRKTIQLAPLIEHSATFALSGSNVNVEFTLADGLWLCDCDENQIGQALDNIVINGKQAMPMGGAITIAAENVSDPAGRHGRYVHISVTDHGIGMPKEILPNIFDPFFSTKKTGHGLGLATVFSIVQRHDGWIDVDSTPGKGSTFHLFLPASQHSEAADTPTEQAMHTDTGTILVMDDEEFMLEIVGDMLQEMGYTVITAKNGQEAIGLFSAARQCSTPFAASILDLTIPGGIGGKEVADAIRQIDAHSIIIASSGYSEHPVISNPVEHGFTDSITKPYRKNELTALMRRIMKP